MNMIFAEILRFGGTVSDSVFLIAQQLTGDNAPGLLSLLIIVFLVVARLQLRYTTRHRVNAMNRFLGKIQETNSEHEFALAVTQLDQIAKSYIDSGSRNRKPIGVAWREFRETIVSDDSDGTLVLRNSVRPSSFFNVDDLNFGAGFWRNLPGLFVTVGLFLTFLGLIAALGAINISPDADSRQMREALNALLGAAKAKFIMSLTGLLASIIFTITLRRANGRIERSIYYTCNAIEERLSYLSPEDIALRQLKLVEGQEEKLKSIGLELVEKLGEPLRKELPAAVAESITQSMAPILGEVSKVGVQGVGNLVSDLSERLSGDVERALGDASANLSAAGDKIAMIADRLDRNVGNVDQSMGDATRRMAEAAEGMVSKLNASIGENQTALNDNADRLLNIMNETLEGIRRNTEEGAVAMRQVAAELKATSETFREQLGVAADEGAKAVQVRMQEVGVEAGKAITHAGQSIMGSIAKNGSDILGAASKEIVEKTRQGILVPLSGISDQMKDIQAKMGSGAERFERTASNLTEASGELAGVAAPIRSLIDSMSKSIKSLEESTVRVGNVVAASARETAVTAEQNLKIAQEMLGGEQKAIVATLENLRMIVQRMESHGKQLDEVDEKLGEAFQQFTTQVEKAIDSLSTHVSNMNEELGPAVDKMHEIVDRAEQFVPKTRS